ncbi:MAG: ATP-grasp domain-containing protein [Tepidisphaeraceae bacterium]|jgi:carbamoyl-phosphate synthase large subunit
MAKPIPVLVTGVGGRSVGHQVLQAVLLAGQRYRPVAADAAAFSYGLYSAKRRYLLPPASSPDYLDAVRRLVAREGIVAILPGTQPETAVLAENAESLGPGCQVIANPSSVIKLCKNKAVLHQWLDANGIATPRSVNAADWESLADQYGFPLVAKPAEDTGGSRGVAILSNADEVRMYLKTHRHEDVVVQQYVGSMESEYTVGVMVSREGRIIDSIVIHRHLVGLSLGDKREIDGKMYALSTGYSQGYVCKHEQIQSACEELALKLGASGPLNIQLRLAGGKVVVFEVHPRFSGTTSVRAKAGFNEADTLIRNFVFGEPFGRIEYRTEVAAIRAFCTVLVPKAQMRGVPRA